MPTKDIKILFSDYSRPSDKKDTHVLNPLIELLSKYWNLVLTPDPDFLIYSAFGCDYLKFKCTRIFYTGENFRPNYKYCDYSFSFDYPVTDRNYRLPWYRLHSEYEKLKSPRTIPDNFKDRKFCCFIVSNERAKERIHMFTKLSQYKQVDSGGKVLNNIGYQIGASQEEKLEWMKGYKFSIVFENSEYPGYTTEKLVDGFLTGTLPIYWGNPLINKDFNPSAFINCHDYQNFESVVDLVKELDTNTDLYQKYFEQQYLPNGEETDFCKEENIIKRFDEIFSSGKSFISYPTKKIQRIIYPIKMGKRKFYKIVKNIRKYYLLATKKVKTIFLRGKNH